MNSTVQKLAIIPFHNPVPKGWHIVTVAEAQEMKAEILPLLKQWSIVALDHGKIDGPGYGCKIHDSYSGECGEKLIIRDLQLAIIPFHNPVPEGWRIIRVAEAQVYKAKILPLLKQWSIVALDHGKIDGPGYGCQIHESYGGECGEKLITREN